MSQRRPHVALLGDGDQAERWTLAFRSLAQVCTASKRFSGQIDAIVVAPGANDPFTQTNEALRAGIPVLYTAPFLLNPWQAGALDELSRRQACLLRFAEPFQYRPGFAFLRRLLEGEEPFWRPIYLRALRLAQPDGSLRIDDLATEALAMCDLLVDGTAQHVTAASSRRDAVGDVCAAFLTIHYADGPLVQCTVSLAEAANSSQLVIATPGRTVILDELDPVAPLRIVGGGEQEPFPEGPTLVPSWQSRTDGLLTSPAPDPVAQEAKGFLGAVAAGDLSAANANRWARVAGLWWAARQSMSFGGPTEVPSPTTTRGHTEPPPLRVIRGGGRTVPTARQRPSLTVVAR